MLFVLMAEFLSIPLHFAPEAGASPTCLTPAQAGPVSSPSLSCLMALGCCLRGTVVPTRQPAR